MSKRTRGNKEARKPRQVPPVLPVLAGEQGTPPPSSGGQKPQRVKK